MAMFSFFSKDKKSPSELAKSGKYREALDSLNEELKTAKLKADQDEKQLSNLYKQIAEVHATSGQIPEAVDNFCKAAQLHDRRGFYEKAVVIYKKALKLDPENTELIKKIMEFNRKVPKYMVNTQDVKDFQDLFEKIRKECEEQEEAEA